MDEATPAARGLGLLRPETRFFRESEPAGIHFNIITFSETHGCGQTGVPTLEHTWFPGHTWSYCQCAECGRHLGWYFSGQHEFVGLITERIVRALYRRN